MQVSGDVFGGHDWGWRGAPGTWWVEARDTARRPAMPRADLRTIGLQTSAAPGLRSLEPAGQALRAVPTAPPLPGSPVAYYRGLAVRLSPPQLFLCNYDLFHRFP